MITALLALAATAATDEIVIKSSFNKWKHLSKVLTSLRVSFTETNRDNGTERVEVFDCTLLLLRNENGLLGKWIRKGRQSKEELVIVYRDGGFHLPSVTEKSLLIYRPEQPLKTAAGAFCPLLMELGANSPFQNFSARVSQQESWYTHIAYKPKSIEAIAELEQGGVVIVRRANDSIPVGAPRRLWHVKPGGQKKVVFDIQKWEMNSKNPPKVVDFDVPTEKDGWKVTVTEGFWKDMKKLQVDK